MNATWNNVLAFAIASLISISPFQSFSQCGEISLIGEFTGWAGDHIMNQDSVNPEIYSTTLFIGPEDDTSQPPDGVIEMKFREDADWSSNWGDLDFPAGTGFQDGPNVLVPLGHYLISFNCVTLDYLFDEITNIQYSELNSTQYCYFIPTRLITC